MSQSLSLYVEEFSCVSQKPHESERDVLIFIHGWGIHGGIWSQIVQTMRHQYDCVVIDLPGIGRSPLPQDEYSLHHVSAWVRQALNVYKSRTIHWVGWSLGAIIAASVSPSFAQSKSVISVAMGSPFIARNEIESAAGYMSQSQFDEFQVLLAEDFEGTLYRFLALNTKGSKTQRAEIRVLQQLVFSYGLPARRALAGGLNILATSSLSALFKTAGNVKKAIILGDKDELVPVESGKRAQQQFSDCAIFVVKNAGHIPFLSDPTGFMKILQSFIEMPSNPPGF